MSPSEPAVCLPGLMPNAVQRPARILRQWKMARDTWGLRLEVPEIARSILPGQFFMLRPLDGTDPLLGRPFALYDVHREEEQPIGVDFGYIRVGKLTGLMPAWQPGQEVMVWGPLGNGFPAPTGRHLMCVAGGIGQTPFLAVCREALGLATYGSPVRTLETRPERVTLCYGARSAEYLAGLEDFQLDGLNLQVSTDDGSHGHHGLVTDLLDAALQSDSPPDQVFCCGPEPMMEAVRERCLAHQVACWLSLETPMACGFGACFSCVVRVVQPDGSWDYRRTCVEGPVFPADQLVF